MSGTSVEDDRGGKGEDDRRGIGMKIANDNPKLSFLLPFCHSCSPSVIPALLLSFLRKQESRVFMELYRG